MEELRKTFLSIGYTEEELNDIINSYSLKTMKTETLVKKVNNIYNYLHSLGYTKEDIIKMTKRFPQIYGLNIENMQQKIEDMQKLGYSKEEVIRITKSLPSIYGLSIENMQQKIIFYDSIGLHQLATIDSKKLMQSTKLSYARYMFYKENGLIINEQNYSKLFINQKRFESQYGLTKVEILEKYQYPPIKIKEHNLKEEITINPIQAAKSLIKQEGVLTEISIIDKMEKEDKKYEKTNEGDCK